MIGIAFKDNGLVQYENQATVLNIKTENGYEDIYPQQLAEGVKLNSNTLKTNGRHIKLNGDTVAEAVEDLESRISLGGRKFEECNIPLTNYSKVKKVLYYHGAYYALVAHPSHDEFIYKSTDGLSWNIIYQNSDDNFILQDMAIFQGDIYIVVWKKVTYTMYRSGVPGVTRNNYLEYEKPIKDNYGYNKGDENCVDDEYLEGEEAFYTDGYDHWNMGLVYDEDFVKKSIIGYTEQTSIELYKFINESNLEFVKSFTGEWESKTYNIYKSGVEGITVGNYLEYEKPIKHNYGYNKGDENCVNDDYLEGEEAFYNEGTDHWNVALIYYESYLDGKIIDTVESEGINLQFLNSNIFIDSNDSFLVASASTEDKIIFFVAMQEQGQLVWGSVSTPRKYNQEIYMNNKLRLIFDTAHLIIGGYYYQLTISVGKPPGQSHYDMLFGLKPIPVGIPPLYTSMSSYLPIQNDIRAIENNNLISLTSNKDIMPFSEDLKYCYDEIYANGKYIYNTLNEATGKSCCKYRWNESYRDVPYETTMVVMEQPLINLTYVGSHVFGVGYNDKKLYSSLVR